MNTRVGHLPTKGDPKRFDEALSRLEQMLAQASMDADAANANLRLLKDNRPGVWTATQLTRYLDMLYRLSGMQGRVEIREGADDRYGKERVGWFCGELIFDCFHDPGSRNRTYIEGSVDHARVLHPERLFDSLKYYQPSPWVPLDPDAAEVLLKPFLDHLEQISTSGNMAHLKYCWDAITMPLPPFEGFFWNWLDQRGEDDDIRLALSLYSLAERGRQRVGGAELETTLMPLLEAAHPMVATHAARFIGSLMDEFDTRVYKPTGLKPTQIIAHLRDLSVNRRAVAGGFLNGIDAMDPNPFAELQTLSPDLNVEDWVMDVLQSPPEDIYLPASQAFWFYLHEHYDRDPAMVMRFVEAGHYYMAWMCITENHPPADGMDVPLKALITRDAGDYRKVAEDVLKQMQSDTG